MHQHVTSDSEDAMQCNLMTTHLTTRHHRKCQLKSSSSNSESDTSTNVHLRNKSKRNSNSRRCVVNRRRRKVHCSGTCLVFLVLTCLVVKTELVLGALTHNSNSRLNSVNYSHDNYTKTLTASDNLPFLDEVDALFGNSYGFNDTLTASPRPQVIYQNEFAVHIVGGEEKANDIAAKHGFTNLGQVSKYFFLLLAWSPQSQKGGDKKMFSRWQCFFFEFPADTKNVFENNEIGYCSKCDRTLNLVKFFIFLDLYHHRPSPSPPPSQLYATLFLREPSWV
jgi:hypothetical protein